MTTPNKKPAGKAGSLQSGICLDYSVTGRCVACFSPVALSWHLYCPRCRYWWRFARGLRTMRTALRGLRV